jgi:hypothetical protein
MYSALSHPCMRLPLDNTCQINREANASAIPASC